MDTVALLRSLLEENAVLDRTGAQAVMAAVLRGEVTAAEVTALLTALHRRGETAEEMVGFAAALRNAAVQLPLTEAERTTLVDTCGTGGDGSRTFNISTAVALVAAAAGARVAKHGNRAVTSQCGSADVLEALGIRIDLTPEEAVAALRTSGFAFLLATRMHPGLKPIAPIRKALPFRTVLNLLGPMVNPAGARRQVMGVYEAAAVGLVAETLARSGTVDHALVVHGTGGIDELSLNGPSLVAEVRDRSVRTFAIVPEDAGLKTSGEDLSGGNFRGGDAAENAAILRSIFAGEQGPRRDVVLLNAGAVLMVAGLATDLRAGATLAAKTIDDGRVTDLLQRLSHR